MTIEYIAPNKRYYAINKIIFDKKGKKLTATLHNDKSGLVLKCTSEKFVKSASDLATRYYKLI